MVFPDFEEFFASLNAHRVKYLIVGAYAVAFHALPRATKDIDVLIERSASNARRARPAIAEFFGASPPDLTEARLRDPRTVFVMGKAPARIDVLTEIEGVSFRDAWTRRAPGVYGSQSVSFLSLEDLIAAKVAAARPQDLVDLDVLERARRAKKTAKR